MHIGSNDNCGCGLSGMGFTDATLTEQPAQQQTWWQKAIEEVTKLIPRTPTSYPVYTPPYSNYPETGYPTESYYGSGSSENLTPWLVIGLVGLYLISRK